MSEDDDFLKSAQREEARLTRKLDAVRALIASYRTDQVLRDEPVVAKPNARPVKRERANSQAGRVLRIAEEFLTAINRRAQSKEIAAEIARHGVVIQGQSPESVVASYLSNSDLFNNIRGLGYGLSAWKGHAANEAPVDAGASKSSGSGSEALFRETADHDR